MTNSVSSSNVPTSSTAREEMGQKPPTSQSTLTKISKAVLTSSSKDVSVVKLRDHFKDLSPDSETSLTPRRSSQKLLNQAVKDILHDEPTKSSFIGAALESVSEVVETQKEAALPEKVTQEIVDGAVSKLKAKYTTSPDGTVKHVKTGRSLPAIDSKNWEKVITDMSVKLFNKPLGKFESFSIGKDKYSACIVPSKKTGELTLKLYRIEAKLGKGGSGIVSRVFKLHSPTEIVQKEYIGEAPDSPTAYRSAQKMEKLWKAIGKTGSEHIPIMKPPSRFVDIKGFKGNESSVPLSKASHEEASKKKGGLLLCELLPKSAEDILKPTDKPQSNRQTLTLIADHLKAQEYFEKAGMMHGDHKPDNMRCKEVNGEWRGVVIDCDGLQDLPLDNDNPCDEKVRTAASKDFTGGYTEKANMDAIGASKTNAELRRGMLARDRIAIGKTFYEECTGKLPAQSAEHESLAHTVNAQAAFTAPEFLALPSGTRFVIQKFIEGDITLSPATAREMIEADKMKEQRSNFSPEQRYLNASTLIDKGENVPICKELGVRGLSSLVVDMLLEPSGSVDDRSLLADTLDKLADSDGKNTTQKKQLQELARGARENNLRDKDNNVVDLSKSQPRTCIELYNAKCLSIELKSFNESLRDIQKSVQLIREMEKAEEVYTKELEPVVDLCSSIGDKQLDQFIRSYNSSLKDKSLSISKDQFGEFREGTRTCLESSRNFCLRLNAQTGNHQELLNTQDFLADRDFIKDNKEAMEKHVSGNQGPDERKVIEGFIEYLAKKTKTSLPQNFYSLPTERLKSFNKFFAEMKNVTHSNNSYMELAELARA